VLLLALRLPECRYTPIGGDTIESMRVTLKAVNDELAKRGFTARLVKASGYFYFQGGEADEWLDKTVRVPNVSSFSLAEWIGEFERLKKLNAEIMGGKGGPNGSKPKSGCEGGSLGGRSLLLCHHLTGNSTRLVTYVPSSQTMLRSRGGFAATRPMVPQSLPSRSKHLSTHSAVSHRFTHTPNIVAPSSGNRLNLPLPSRPHTTCCAI
jgi:hypothetical protein